MRKAERRMNFMKKLSVAVIGCGNVSRRHLATAEKSEFSELVAVCDIKAEKADAAAEKYAVKAFYNIDELLAWGKFDVLHICTPHYLHAEMAISAMNCGKHVFCEKPLAIHYEDAVKMCECAEKNNVYLGTCFQNRYNVSSVYLKELAESRKLGSIEGMKANVTWDRDEKYYSDDWHGTLGKEGGGVIINQCIHTLDLMQWLMGSEVVSVDGSISQKRLKGKVETEDTADALITFENGRTALFYGTLCYNGNSPVFLEILFENGKAVMYEDLMVCYENGEKEIVSLDKVSGKHSYWGSGHEVIINDFYESILGGRKFAVCGESGSVAVKIVDLLYKSARN